MKLENLKLRLLDFFESGDLAAVDSVVHLEDQSDEVQGGTADLRPIKRRWVQVPEAREEQQGNGKEDDGVCQDFIPTKCSCVLGK